MNTTKTSHDPADRRFAFPFGLLTTAFLLRVFGQAVQRWSPVEFLPRFNDWQGSSLPYAVLLGAQIAILAIAVYVTWKMATGANVVGARWTGRILIFGIIYFATMAIRIVLGLTLLPDVDWFTSWISSSFHLVLAVKVVLIGVYQSATLMAHE